MYKKSEKKQLKLLDEFQLVFGGKLNPENRWVKLSKLIPWEKIEEKYAILFSDTGAPAKKLRLALGALIIKEKLNITDRETVDQIQENPYLQYFIGRKNFESKKKPFDPSSMVHFRKRLEENILQEINEMIINSNDNKDNKNDDSGSKKKNNKEKNKSSKTKKEENSNKGSLCLDATCTPSDISYPTDLSLLNESREITEKLIDHLHDASGKVNKKPRTYRNRARKEFLRVSKSRKPRKKEIRKTIRKQLGYVNRNIKTINKMLDMFEKMPLTYKEQRKFWIIQEVYRQQKEMYQEKKHNIENRIVSISQPHVRPIVRGKKNASVEFGAKVSIALVDGYTHVEKNKLGKF